MVDHTGKIGRQVGWLNQNAGLREKISYSDVVELLSAMDITSAMKILKDVEESASKIEHPTNYILAAAHRAVGGMSVRSASTPGGGFRANGGGKWAEAPNSTPQTDHEKSIAKQVGWLNKNVALAERVSYSDVVGPLSLLDLSVAKKIFKDLEEGAGNIRNPTGYVAAAAHRASSEGMVVRSDFSLGGAFRATGGSKWAEASNSTPQTDHEKSIAKQIGWLNQNVALAERVSYSDVVGPLVLLDLRAAMKILKDLEEGAGHICNPTGYVAAAAHRAASAGMVVRSDFSLGGAFHATGGGKWAESNSTPQTDHEKKIAKQVGWLNQNVVLAERVSYSDVVGPLSCLNPNAAMKILNDLAEGAGNIHNPTGYVTAAAHRAGSTSVLHSPVGVGGKGVGGVKRRWEATKTVWTVPNPISLPAGQSSSVVPNASPETNEGKKIAQQVGWINRNVGLHAKISYSDVKEVLERCDVRAAFKILKDLEKQGASVQDPTAYVYAAAVRVSSIETEPLEDLEPGAEGICQRASDLGLELSDETFEQLGMIDPSEAAELLSDTVKGGFAGQGVKNPDDYIAKACRRILSGLVSAKRTRQT